MQATNLTQFWFLDTLVFVRISEHDSPDGISVLEHHAYHGDSPPLHIHHTEDEIFFLIEGDFRFLIGAEEYRRKAGETMLAPKGVPHTYRVESQYGGKWLTITARGDFERFVRQMSRPAEKNQLPERTGPPSEEAAKLLVTKAAEHHIEIVGPPLF